MQHQHGHSHSGGHDHGHSHSDGHHHGHSHSDGLHQGEEQEEQELEIEDSTLCELVPGAAIHNLIVRVAEVKDAGEAVIETAHGTCTLMFDHEKLGFLVKPDNTVRILSGFGWTEESGKLVLRLEDPEEEAIQVELDVDPDEVTPPPECAQNSISKVSRLYGLLVIREDKCLLCPAGLTEGKFSFPVSEADGDEPERTAALRAFQSITEIDVSEVYILNEVPSIVAYEEEEFISVIYVAYSRRPFRRNAPPPPPNSDDAYSWFTFDQAFEALETDGSKSCLQRAHQALKAAIGAGYIRTCLGASFGPQQSLPPIIPKQQQPQRVPDDQVSSTANEEQIQPKLQSTSRIASPESIPMFGMDALVARTSALFYLREKGLIGAADFEQRLRNQPTEATPGAPAEIPDSAGSPSDVKRVIPVTILSGFLGVGKTTLVNHILGNKRGLKIALVVNDMAEVNIDAQLISKKAAKEDVIEMTNGCICCTLREDLLEEVFQLAKSQKYDCIMVESTGVGEPLAIAETFTFAVNNENMTGVLNDYARLDTLVTVVDASSVLRDLSLVHQGKQEPQLAGLLTEQIEFANVIVLNKLDLVTVGEINKVRAVVNSLNPRAKKIESIRGAVPLEEIVDTKLFSFQEAQSAPGWLQTLRGEKTPETLEYGIGSVVWRNKAQMVSPVKLAARLTEHPFSDVIIRSKGIVWLNNKLGRQHSVEWSGAGHVYNFFIGREWPEGHVGQNEVVLIGFFEDSSLAEKALRMLDDCLVDLNADLEVGGDTAISVITEAEA